MATSRTTRIIGFSVPPATVLEVEALAKEERRTKSELFREMVRVYRRYRAQRDRDEDRWIAGIIEETAVEQVRKPVATEQLLAESERLAEYGARQAGKLGIALKDTDRLIHDYRARKRT